MHCTDHSEINAFLDQNPAEKCIFMCSSHQFMKKKKKKKNSCLDSTRVTELKIVMSPNVSGVSSGDASERMDIDTFF